MDHEPCVYEKEKKLEEESIEKKKELKVKKDECGMVKSGEISKWVKSFQKKMDKDFKDKFILEFPDDKDYFYWDDNVRRCTTCNMIIKNLNKPHTYEDCEKHLKIVEKWERNRGRRR